MQRDRKSSHAVIEYSQVYGTDYFEIILANRKNRICSNFDEINSSF